LKDFQQLAVVRRMARELSLPVEVVGCPIVREVDGLALSSRNVRLSPAERQAAIVLSRALAAGQAALAGGDRSGASVTRAMRAVVAAEPLVALDYAVLVDADTLQEVGLVADDDHDHDSLRLLIAAQVGPVRLIDNSDAFAATDDVRSVPGATEKVRQLERIG
jgi:pantoate--beta-alanine ligase